MATTVTFNGFSFQDTSIITPEIDRYSMPSRVVQAMDITRSNRQKVVAAYLKEKTIKIAGVFVASTEEALQAKISEARRNLMTLEGVLQIPFNGLTLQYQATVTKYEFPRKNYNKSFCNYVVEFSCVNPPYGVDSVLNTESMTTTTGSDSSSFTAGGEVEPEPTFTVTVNSETDMTVFKITSDDTGESITITPSGGFDAGDILIIASQSKSVLLNGAPQDYTGIFPLFAVGLNNFTVDITSTTHNVTVDTSWQDNYL